MWIGVLRGMGWAALAAGWLAGQGVLAAPTGTDFGGVHPLHTAAGQLNPKALLAFDRAVGSARVVALGEDRHLVEEYHQLRLPLIQHLILNRGFRRVSIESPWSGALPVQQYLQGCRGGTVPAIAPFGDLLPIWNSQSLRQLLQWICAFNRMHPRDPVHFAGFDTSEAWYSMRELERLAPVLGRPGGGLSSVLAAMRSSCVGVNHANATAWRRSPEMLRFSARFEPVPEAAHRNCMAALQAFARASAWPDGVSPARAEAEFHLRNLYAAQENVYFYNRSGRGVQVQLDADQVRAWEIRDRNMAANLLATVAAMPLKTVIVAANSHITADFSRVGSLIPGTAGFPNFGLHVFRALGVGGYAPFGLFGYHVVGGGESAAPPPAADSLEGLLQSLRMGDVYVSSASAVFGVGRKIRFNRGVQVMVPAEQYRGMFFLERGGPMRILR